MGQESLQEMAECTYHPQAGPTREMGQPEFLIMTFTPIGAILIVNVEVPSDTSSST